MFHLPYNKNLKEFSRYLRKNSTLSEVLLWNELKNKKLRGYQFNRQKPIGNYIVDFYCRKLNLVIEIDGTSHQSEEAFLKDSERQKVIEELYVKFLRFNDKDVKNNLSGVLFVIGEFINDFERTGL